MSDVPLEYHIYHDAKPGSGMQAVHVGTNDPTGERLTEALALVLEAADYPVWDNLGNCNLPCNYCWASLGGDWWTGVATSLWELREATR